MESEESDVERPQQRPRKQPQKQEKTYDFFDITGQGLDEIIEFDDLDEPLEVEVEEVPSPVLEEPEVIEKVKEKRVISLDSDSDSEVEMVRKKQRPEPVKQKPDTPPFDELDLLKKSVAIKTFTSVASTRLRMDDVQSTSKTKEQILIKIEPQNQKAFKLRIYNDVPLKDVFIQAAQKLQLEVDKVILTFNSIRFIRLTRLFPSTRPKDVGLLDGGKLKACSIQEFTNQVEQSERMVVSVVFHLSNGTKKYRVTIAMTDPIRPVFDHLAVSLQLSPKDIVLEFNEVRLYPLSIPKNVGLEEGSQIVGYLETDYQTILKQRQDKNTTFDEPVVASGFETMGGDKRIKIKVVLEGEQHVLWLLPDSSVSQIVKKLKQKINSDRNIVVKFDGERLDPVQTLEDCDIENEDMLEAKFM